MALPCGTTTSWVRVLPSRTAMTSRDPGPPRSVDSVDRKGRRPGGRTRLRVRAGRAGRGGRGRGALRLPARGENHGQAERGQSGGGEAPRTGASGHRDGPFWVGVGNLSEPTRRRPRGGRLPG